MIASVAEVDFIEELRLRRQARERYLPLTARGGLHPIIVDELNRMDAEGMPTDNHPSDDTLLSDHQSVPTSLFGSRIVPLMPEHPDWHGPHEITGAHATLRVGADARELHYT
jgi:hypothetical protein